MSKDKRIITYPGGPAGTVYFPGFPGLYSGATVLPLVELAASSGLPADELVALITDLNLPLVVSDGLPTPPKEE